MLVYTAARVVVFALAAVILKVLLPGLDPLLLLGIALLVSALLSYALLARQRDAVTEVVARRAGGVRRWELPRRG